MLDDHHLASSAMVGEKANKDAFHKYYEKYTRKLMYVEDRNNNLNDIWIVYWKAELFISLNTKYRGIFQTIAIINILLHSA